jgi:hypothetical protein
MEVVMHRAKPSLGRELSNDEVSEVSGGEPGSYTQWDPQQPDYYTLPYTRGGPGQGTMEFPGQGLRCQYYEGGFACYYM